MINIALLSDGWTEGCAATDRFDSRVIFLTLTE